MVIVEQLEFHDSEESDRIRGGAAMLLLLARVAMWIYTVCAVGEALIVFTKQRIKHRLLCKEVLLKCFGSLL